MSDSEFIERLAEPENRPAEQRWYVQESIGDEVRGPYSSQSVQRLYDLGLLTTKLSRVSMAGQEGYFWERIHAVPELVPDEFLEYRYKRTVS